MRFITYRIDNQHSFGAVIENRVVDLDRRMNSHDSLLEVIQAGALIRAKDIAAESSADYELKDIVLCQPVIKPGKVICLPLKDTAESSGYSMAEEIYLRPAESLAGNDAPLIIAEGYRAQLARPALALVVGSGGWRIAEKHTRNAIAGIALANNGAVQSWQQRPMRPGQGSTFPACGATGPWLVTLDDIDDANQLNVSCQVNDQPPRHFSGAQLQKDLAAQISELSHFIQLDPGDLILVDLPEAGSDELLDCTLAAGDRISMQSDELGSLSNSVIAETDSCENVD